MSREIKKSVTLKQMPAVDSRGVRYKVVRAVNTLINQGVRVTIK